MARFPKYIPECFSGIAPRQISEGFSKPGFSKLDASEMDASKLDAVKINLAKRPLKFCVTSLVLTLSLIAGGCATKAPDPVVVEPSPSATPVVPSKQAKPPVVEDPPSKEPLVPSQPDGQAAPANPPAADGEMVTVSVYTIDDQCNDFVEQSLQVPSDKAMIEAVGQAMNAMDYNALKLEGYQVNINGDTATVDLKLSPGSERQFVSLSSCEQRALFGSVEETLLNNAQWNVKAVKFTDGGKEIVL